MEPHESDALVLTAACEAEPAVLLFGEHDPEEDHLQLLESVKRRGQSVLASGVPVFHTASGPAVKDAYLASIPEDWRQEYNCRCCKRFLRQYGDLVYVDDEGRSVSLFWPSENELDELPLTTENSFWASIQAMRKAAEAFPIVSPVYTSSGVLGNGVSGDFSHFHVGIDHDHPALANYLLTPTQLASKKVQNYKRLRRALEEFGPSVIGRAVKLLGEGGLDYTIDFDPVGDFCIMAKWLQDVLKDMATAKNERFADNLVWRRVATAPAGYATSPSTILGWMLKEIKKGLASDSTISFVFCRMVERSYSSTPRTAAPTQNQVRKAAIYFAKLGLELALRRRKAVLDDIPPRLVKWRPAKVAETESNGVFAGLKTKEKKSGHHNGFPMGKGLQQRDLLSRLCLRLRRSRSGLRRRLMSTS